MLGGEDVEARREGGEGHDATAMAKHSRWINRVSWLSREMTTFLHNLSAAVKSRHATRHSPHETTFCDMCSVVTCSSPTLITNFCSPPLSGPPCSPANPLGSTESDGSPPSVDCTLGLKSCEMPPGPQ